jgi:hypothetical protein
VRNCEVSTEKAACGTCSATWNLCRIEQDLDRVGRPQDLPDAN